MAEYETAEKILKAGGKYHHRTCRICKEPIYFIMIGRQLYLMACQTCRMKPKANSIAISWDDLKMLLGRYDHHDVH